jgi:GLPGLI family protein
MLKFCQLFSLRNLLVNLVRLFVNESTDMKRSITLLSLVIALFLGSNSFAQKAITEATISYDIVISNNSPKPQVADLLDGATSVVYLKGPSSRSEMVSSLGKQTTIIDGKSGAVVVLKDYGEQKYMITMTPENWKESNKKYEGVTFDFVDEYKTIAGYKSQKAVGKLADGNTFTVYFTRDLVPQNRDFQYLNKNLPGLALQYEASFGKLLVTYTVSNINFNPVPVAKFDLPKAGYRVMTYEESRKAVGGN